MTTPSADQLDAITSEFLDTTGLMCPEPVMLLHNKVRDIGVGEHLKITATDPSTQRDIPRFCEFLGHQLLLQQELAGKYYYWIKKSNV